MHGRRYIPQNCTTGGRQHHPTYPCIAGSEKHIERSARIDIEVEARILDQIDHTRVGRQVNDGIAAGDSGGDSRKISYVAMREPYTARQIVASAHRLVIENDQLRYRIAPPLDAPNEIGADEATAARDKHLAQCHEGILVIRSLEYALA